MRELRAVGHAWAAVLMVVGLAHVVIGFKGIGFLGVALPAEIRANAVLDSQDRFYGVMLCGFGVLLALGLRDVVRYRTVLATVAWTMLAGGLARLLSVAVVGWPTSIVVLFIAFELVLPVVLLGLLSKATAN